MEKLTRFLVIIFQKVFLENSCLKPVITALKTDNLLQNYQQDLKVTLKEVNCVPEWLSWLSAFSSGHDRRVLGLSPTQGFLLSGASISTSPSTPPPALALSLSYSHSLSTLFLKKYIFLFFLNEGAKSFHMVCEVSLEFFVWDYMGENHAYVVLIIWQIA